MAEVFPHAVRDFAVELHTLHGLSAEAVTPLINGQLYALIIASDKRVTIRVSLDSFPDIALFEEYGFEGTYYIPLRISAVSKTAQVFNYGPQPWFLNESLRIMVADAVNASVRVTVRYG